MPPISYLPAMLQEAGLAPHFTCLEIGARTDVFGKEPCHQLLNDPGSKIIAFEVDPTECQRLSRQAPPGVTYHPYAIGRAEEKRPLYITHALMCTSLCKPNTALIDLYQNLEMMKVKHTVEVQTVSLDYFAREAKLGPVDFIKIDIQGAELDAFQGAARLLSDVLAIVSEVEFVPLYEAQPLFADVSAHLSQRGFLFHKFVGVCGRAMRPFVVHNDVNFPVQHLWADALYFRDITKINTLSSDQLLKMATLMELYDSPDVTHFLLSHYDGRHQTALAPAYEKLAQLQRPSGGF